MESSSKLVLTYFAEDNTITSVECDLLTLGDVKHGHATMQAVKRGQNSEPDVIVADIPAAAFIGLGWEQEGA